MRMAPTTTEALLWQALSGSQLGVGFRRHFVIGRFITDFAAPAARLVVEVDGGYHRSRRRADARRDREIARLGWRVLRLPAEMVRDRLSHEDVSGGFLLDGYPRTVAQVEELDRILEANGVGLDVVLLLTADNAELVSRLLGRAQEQGRTDDTEDVIRHRLDVYDEQTAPVVGVYEDRGIVVRVDGLGSIDEVTERIMAALPR